MNDLMQQGYRYGLTEPVGRNFHPNFRLQLASTEVLALGVFGEKYMTDCRGELHDVRRGSVKHPEHPASSASRSLDASWSWCSLSETVRSSG